MSYGGTFTPAVRVDGSRGAEPKPAASGSIASANGKPASNGTHPITVPAAPIARAKSACPCPSQASGHGAESGSCGCPDRERRPLVTESYTVSRYQQATSDGRHASNGRPDFTRMNPAERLAYHRERLGLGADSGFRSDYPIPFVADFAGDR